MRKWRMRFIKLAQHFAGWSKDPSTQVGAVITRGNEVLQPGYNGFPPGIPDDPGHYADRSEKYPRVVHAEMNALLRCRHDTEGATITVFPLPMCADCAGAAITKGIREVVQPPVPSSDRSAATERVALDMFEKAGVRVVTYRRRRGS